MLTPCAKMQQRQSLISSVIPKDYRTLTDLNEVAYGHGHRERDILWSSGGPLQRGSPLSESHQPSCRPLIAKGIDSSSTAGRIGHLLQVAPVESAAARSVFRYCERFPPLGTPDRALTTSGDLSGQLAHPFVRIADDTPSDKELARQDFLIKFAS
jgi:hypothetical protein